MYEPFYISKNGTNRLRNLMLKLQEESKLNPYHFNGFESEWEEADKNLIHSLYNSIHENDSDPNLPEYKGANLNEPNNKTMDTKNSIETENTEAIKGVKDIQRTILGLLDVVARVRKINEKLDADDAKADKDANFRPSLEMVGSNGIKVALRRCDNSEPEDKESNKTNNNDSLNSDPPIKDSNLEISAEDIQKAIAKALAVSERAKKINEKLDADEILKRPQEDTDPSTTIFADGVKEERIKLRHRKGHIEKKENNPSEDHDKPNSNYEYVNHPSHYNHYSYEVIDMMEKIYGLDATIQFCEMNAFKYRMRMGTKPNADTSQDLEKEKWYLNKAEELKSKKAKDLTNSIRPL